jgi:hypothetical protein
MKGAELRRMSAAKLISRKDPAEALGGISVRTVDHLRTANQLE